MVYVKRSDDLKQRALELYLEHGWSLENVLEAIGVTKRTLKRWEHNYNTYGHVRAPVIGVGAPRIMKPAVLAELEELVQQDPSLYLDEITQWLVRRHGQHISLSAMCNNLRDLELDRKRLRIIAAQRDTAFRTAWFDRVARTYTARQMVFTDESSKDGRTLARRFGRAPSGETPEDYMDHNRGDRYSILPALSLDGYIALRVVEGSVDSEEFYDFVVTDLLPKMNPFPQERSVLILDNCNTHKSESLRVAVEAHGCVLLFLPPYSPDFNPIEESFSAIKAYLQRYWRVLDDALDPVAAIAEACIRAVTAENTRGWFAHSGYL